MARVVVCGAGAVGAFVALELARLDVGEVVLADVAGVASGATGRAFGGVRQQFSTAAEVMLARESVACFEALGSPLFEQVGYLFLATNARTWEALRERHVAQSALGVPVQLVAADEVPGLARGVHAADVHGALFCALDGTAEPARITRNVVRRALGHGVELREGVDGLSVPADVHVIACGARSAEVAARRGVRLPVRPLVRQLVETGSLTDLDPGLPVVIDAASGFHLRRRGDVLRLALADPAPRWTHDAVPDPALATRALAELERRFPATSGRASAERVWAGLYDMTPDAHPILGQVDDGLWAACGFSGHGFMQAPAAGRAIAEEIVLGASRLDLSPFRLARFDSGATFPEHVVL